MPTTIATLTATITTTTAINSNINNIKQKFKSKFKLNNSILAAAQAEAAAEAAAAAVRSDHVMPVERMPSLRQSQQSLCCRHDAWRITVAVTDEATLHLNRGNITTKTKTIEDSWPFKSDLVFNLRLHLLFSLFLSPASLSERVALKCVVVFCCAWHGSWLKWSSLPKSFVLFGFFRSNLHNIL